MQPKPKRKSVPRLKRKLWVTFSRFVRLRDCMETTGTLTRGRCITCGVEKPIEELDAGHFIPKKSGNYFSEKGVHAQCRACNRFHSGRPLEYQDKLIEMYGKRVVNKLRKEAQQSIKYSVIDIEELTCYYKEEIKKLEELN